MKETPMRKLFLAAAALAACWSVQAQVKWDLPTAYAPASFQTENVQQFANDVDKATAGKLKIVLHPNASLYKANEIKRAVQTGQTQAGEFILSGASNENPMFGVDSVPFLATSYEDARRLYTVSRPSLEKLLASQGMKLLFSVPWPGQSLYSVKPINSVDDFKGSKMRAYNPATSRIAQLLKAQPTTIQLAELGQALATGTVENFLTSSASGIEMKLHEQTKHLYPVNAWLPRNATVVNLKAFEALDKAQQDAVLKAAAAAEQRGWHLSEQKDREYLQELAAKGMKIAPPSEAVRRELRAIGETMTAEWLKTAGPEGKQVVDAYLKH
jgi:TRAP-type transport system periplasmic protein